MTSKITYQIGDNTFSIECNSAAYMGFHDCVELRKLDMFRLDSPDYIRDLKLALQLIHIIARIESIYEYAYSDKCKQEAALKLRSMAFEEMNELIGDSHTWEPEMNRAMETKIDIYLTVVENTPGESKSTNPKQNHSPGYVYLLQAEKGYKIGMSKTPKKRIKSMGVKLPFPIDTICTIKTDDMIHLESELHLHFAKKRINGEWFNLGPEDIEYIKGLQS